jgi:Protein of unknown function (DUF3558)
MKLSWGRHGSAAAVLIAATATAALAGCASSGSTAASGPASSPPAAATPKATAAATAAPAANSCGVITQSQAAAALGQPAKAPILGKATVEGGVACVFYGPDVPPGTSPDIAMPDSVRVVLVTGANAAKWFDNYRAKVHARAISGLGDQAYYDGVASVSVLQGNAYVRIAVGIPNNLGVEETLAREALPNM